MMLFRRLYWVAEQVDPNGRSKVTGVYTSIQDLMGKGLRWCEEGPCAAKLRLTLVKPDSFNCPIGVWESPDFSGMREALDELVGGNEYSRDECTSLERELDNFVAQTAKAS